MANMANAVPPAGDGAPNVAGNTILPSLSNATASSIVTTGRPLIVRGLGGSGVRFSTAASLNACAALPARSRTL